MLHPLRRKWYELRWGPEEADALMHLKGKDRALRLAILEEHGAAEAAVLFERRKIQAAIRHQARKEKETPDAPFLAQFAKSMAASARRMESENHVEEVDRAAAELANTLRDISDKLRPTPEQLEVANFAEVVVQAITERNRIASQVDALTQKQAFLEAMLAELSSDNVMVPDLESQLLEVRKVLPEAQRYWQDFSNEVDKLKQEMVLRERQLRSKQAISNVNSL